MTFSRPNEHMLRIALAFFACFNSLFFVYRIQLLSGGAKLPGDLIDARIALAIEQHWYNVFRGLEKWNEPLYFAPSKNVLGYNDGYFLFGIPFSVCRFIGLDPFISGELAGASFRIIGFFGFLLLAWKVLCLPYGWAVLAAILVTISNAIYLQTTPHIQLVTVGLAPALIVLIWSAIRNLQDGSRNLGILLLCLGAILFDSWLLTAFYTIWFFILFVILAGGTAIISRPRDCWICFSQIPFSFYVPAIFVGFIGFLPFTFVYVAKAQETGMHSLIEAMNYTPSVFDLIHTGSGNLLFGWLDQIITNNFRPGFPNFGEHTAGFPLILFLFALFSAFTSIFSAKFDSSNWWRSIVVAFLLSLLLCVHVRNFSLWKLVYDFVPGAKAVRGVSRYLLFLDLIAVLLAVRITALWSRHIPVGISIIIACALILEEVTTNGGFTLDRYSENQFLARIPKPPEGCKAFYIDTPRMLFPEPGSEQIESFLLNVDAMMIAELDHLQTPNGHASFLPVGFGMVFRDSMTYPDDARSSILAHNLDKGMCGLNLAAATWSDFKLKLPILHFGETLSFAAGSGANRYMLRGWSGPEPRGTWTVGPIAELGLKVDRNDADVSIELEATAFGVAGQPSPVDVFANDQLIAHWRPISADQTLGATVSKQMIPQDGMLKVRFEIASPASPYEVGLSQDTRKLGLFAERMKLTQSGR